MSKYLIGFFLYFIMLAADAANLKDLEMLTKINNEKKQSLDLSNADLKNYQFTPGKIDLKNANLSGADLTNANLENMDLTNADLSHSNLTNAKLKGAILANANLSYAKLTAAYLEKTNLTKADLTCANLDNANLTKADFSETIISGASFANTNTVDVGNYESVIDTKIVCNR